MSDLRGFNEIELCEDTVSVDTLTGATVSAFIRLKSGARCITLGVNTIEKLAQYLREHGRQI